jgi:hypothetical protein
MGVWDARLGVLQVCQLVLPSSDFSEEKGGFVLPLRPGTAAAEGAVQAFAGIAHCLAPTRKCLPPPQRARWGLAASQTRPRTTDH